MAWLVRYSSRFSGLSKTLVIFSWILLAYECWEVLGLGLGFDLVEFFVADERFEDI